MNPEYQKILNKSKAQRKVVKKRLKKLKSLSNSELDRFFHEGHEKAFEQINCLECANCCKTTGPLFTKKDRERIAKYLGMKTSDFEDKYLQVDEDEDWVLQETPCAFLGEDNYCSIYNVRPKACAGFPHTDHAGMKSLLKITEKNSRVCPAVASILTSNLH